MKKASRGRGLRVGIAGAAAALATMAFGASQAQAVTFGADLNNAFLKTGAFPNPGLDINNFDDDNDPLTPPIQNIVTIQGDVTPTPPSSPFTVPAGCIPANPLDGFCFPDFAGTVLGGAVGVQVAIDSTEAITGTINSTTGELATVASDFNAELILDFTPDMPLSGDEVTCVIGDIPGGDDTPDFEMAFNTTQPFPSPYAGDPFTVTIPPFTDVVSNGAMVATWPTLPAAIKTAGPPAGNCATVDSLSSGRGGLWLADNIATPALNAAPPAPPGTTTPPATTTPKKCKKGQKLKKGKCVKKKKKKKK